MALGEAVEGAGPVPVDGEYHRHGGLAVLPLPEIGSHRVVLRWRACRCRPGRLERTPSPLRLLRAVRLVGGPVLTGGGEGGTHFVVDTVSLCS